jgi:hypothetical protein
MADKDKMLAEETKMIEDIMREFGGDAITVLHPDEAGRADTTNSVTFLTFDCGNHDQALGMAKAANQIVANNPKAKLTFTINGCADDPREVDQIPDARAVLCTLFKALEQTTFWRFDAVSQGLMLVAMGLGERDGNNLLVLDGMVREPS